MSTSTNEALRTKFRRMREAAGITQRGLGRRVGLTGSAVSQMEIGTNGMRLDHLRACCTEIGTDLLVDILPPAEAALVRRFAHAVVSADSDLRAWLTQTVTISESCRRQRETPDDTAATFAGSFDG